MNLLGHLYLSEHKPFEVQLFNLLGDRYKGRKFPDLTANAVQGIYLHRDIDNFIDTHPAVSALRQEIAVKMPKVAGIAIDIYFDYLLASEWEKYHSIALNDFINLFFDNCLKQPELVPEPYKAYISNLHKNRYLHQYNDFESVKAISHFLHQKLKNSTQLHQTSTLFPIFEAQIRACFQIFIHDAKENFRINRY